MYDKTKLEPNNKMLMIRARGKLSTEVKLSFNQRFLSGDIFKFSRETILCMSFDTLVSHPRGKEILLVALLMLRKLEIRAHLMGH